MEKEERTKREIALKIMCFISFFIYLSLIFFSIVFSWKIHFVWFSIAILLIGGLLILKSIFYNLDSSLFLGILLFLFGMLGIFNLYFDFNNLLGLYFCVISFSSIIIFFIFRQKFYLVLFSMFAIEGFLVILLNELKVEVVFFWAVQGIYILIILLLLYYTFLNYRTK